MRQLLKDSGMVESFFKAQFSDFDRTRVVRAWTAPKFQPCVKVFIFDELLKFIEEAGGPGITAGRPFWRAEARVVQQVRPRARGGGML